MSDFRISLDKANTIITATFAKRAPEFRGE